MSVLVQPAPPDDLDVRTDSRAHLRALLNDTLKALAAIDTGDYSSADTALRDAMMSAHATRSALVPALQPPAPSPKSEVDRALQEWAS
jgi:hypothetical protein